MRRMQTILFKTFLDKGHENVDARVMLNSKDQKDEESLYGAIARSEISVRIYCLYMYIIITYT